MMQLSTREVLHCEICKICVWHIFWHYFFDDDQCFSVVQNNKIIFCDTKVVKMLKLLF